MLKSRKGKVIALVGAQFGSEGKGVIAAHLANEFKIHVRTGGVNAGHTFMYHGYKQYIPEDKSVTDQLHHKIVMQTVPVGWINKNAALVLGVGSLIDLDKLNEEIGLINEFDSSIKDRLIIDANAGVISPWHALEEGGVHGQIHERIGSTGKGVGAARRDRVCRLPDRFKRICEVDLDQYPNIWPGMLKYNTAKGLNGSIERGADVLLEGTQGTGLDLLHGPWPYTTSNGCTTAQLLNDCGIAPSLLTDTVLVARTYPIRVAGNSGPMFDETTWEDISSRVGKPTTEKTTVTKKTRRVGHWDDELFDSSVMLNGARSVAITFMDYMFPQDEGKMQWGALSQEARDWCEYIELRFRTVVRYIGTGWNEQIQDWAVIRK